MTERLSCITPYIFPERHAVTRSRRLTMSQPGLPIHPIFGHVVTVAKVAMKLPQRSHTQVLATYLMREHDTPGVFFLDARPISVLSLFVTAPYVQQPSASTLLTYNREIARQVSDSALTKPPVLGTVLEPIAGKFNMLSTADHTLWKKWRSIFNPGFSIQQIVSRVPV